MNVTRALCAAIGEMDYESLPGDVVEQAKMCLLDWLGVALGGASEPLTRILMEVTDIVGGAEQASIIGHGRKDSMLNAALINGSASHALDFDDVHLQFMGHPTVPVMPALLALAETRGSSGRDFITAFVAGFEAECRIGSSVFPMHYQQGYHSTSTVGRFGAAIACAKLMNLDSERMNYSIGLAGTQAAGLKQVFGTMAKPFHAGKAAMDGLLSALLAERNFTCSDDILAGKTGFCEVLSPAATPEVIAEGFGKDYAIRTVIFKRHASCFETHPAIDAMLALRSKVRAEDVAEIRVAANPMALEIAGKTAPETGLEGKFSIGYCAALALTDGETGEASFTDEMVARPDLVELTAKVSLEGNEDYGFSQAEVVLRTKDGRELIAAADTLDSGGDKENRKIDLVKKFRSFADRALPAGRSDAILKFVNELEEQTNVGELAALCCP